jgi:antitoxin component of RelBE/YafQ-DinJ toxin-antitoxin module|tara:strand:- start:414 stop:566 length:153 start_codon:yes stop_codon:yes gene_type:complete
MIPLNKKKTELVTIRVEAEMKKNIEQIATDNVATTSEVIRYALNSLIANQ